MIGWPYCFGPVVRQECAAEVAPHSMVSRKQREMEVGTWEKTEPPQ
jgi:hypothetical protein